jgi:hypothetical protein
MIPGVEGQGVHALLGSRRGNGVFVNSVFPHPSFQGSGGMIPPAAGGIFGLPGAAKKKEAVPTQSGAFRDAWREASRTRRQGLLRYGPKPGKH